MEDSKKEKRQHTTWDFMFELYNQAMKDGIEIIGTTVYKGYKLGIWCQNQRSQYKNGTLSSERVVRLDSVGFVWDVNASSWDSYFELYKQALADGVDLTQEGLYKGVRLGSWVHTQRQRYKNGTLSQDRVDKLNSVGFVWDVSRNAWSSSFELYKQAKSEGVNPVAGTVYIKVLV